jgi:hypothetical protein
MKPLGAIFFTLAIVCSFTVSVLADRGAKAL